MRGRIRMLEGSWAVVGAVATFGGFLNILTLTVPLFMLQVYDRVMVSGSVPTLVMLSIIALGCLVAYTALDVVRSRLVSRLSAHLEYRLGPMALESAVVAGARRGSPKSSQPLRDLQEVRSFISSPGFLAFLDVPWVPAYAALIFMMHPVLGGVAICGAITLATLGIFSEVIGRRLQKEAREASVKAARSAEGYIRHADVVNSMGLLASIESRWLRDVGKAFAPMSVAADRSILMSALAKLVRALLQIALLASGAVLVLQQEITAGQMIAASVLSARAFAPLEQAITAWRAMTSARGAWERLRDAVATIRLGGSQLRLPEPEGHIGITGVRVHLPGGGAALLDGVDLEIAAGEIVGVTGPSGAGKSTLARLLAGLETPSEGAIRLDGANYADWPPDQLGSVIGYLPQVATLFSGTVAENIAALDLAPDPEQVATAARIAGIHEMILGLHGGYNADVGWDGESLSAGQRQRIGLARAFYGDRKIIVLDEPNANLDAAGDAALAKAIDWARRLKRTVIIVSHRRNVLSLVDRIVLVERGRISRVGRPSAGIASDRIQAAKDPIRRTSAASAPIAKPSQPDGLVQSIDRARGRGRDEEAAFEAMVRELRKVASR